MGAHIALRPGSPMGFLGWVLPQRTQPMGAHSAVYLFWDCLLDCYFSVWKPVRMFSVIDLYRLWCNRKLDLGQEINSP
jgi:hypothetical protein